jgi:glyoxylase-like metal-dependent hydrolase (beta-lactamase superfamily II)
MRGTWSAQWPEVSLDQLKRAKVWLKATSYTRLVPAPGHARGMQVVVVETGGRPVVVGGDVAVWFGEFDEPHTEGQLRVRALDPELVWLAHEHEPWRPRTV